MSYLLYWLQPISPGSKSYKFSVPFPTSTKLPLISVNEDTRKYVKAILLNREKVLGKQISAGENYYSPDDAVRIIRLIGGLDATVEQVTSEEYRKQLAALGVPGFFINDMSDNVKYIEECGFFDAKSMKEGQEVSCFFVLWKFWFLLRSLCLYGYHVLVERLETFQEWVATSEQVAAMKSLLVEFSIGQVAMEDEFTTHPQLSSPS